MERLRNRGLKSTSPAVAIVASLFSGPGLLDPPRLVDGSIEPSSPTPFVRDGAASEAPAAAPLLPAGGAAAAESPTRLDHEQERAVTAALGGTTAVAAIVGGPGTGKTTALVEIMVRVAAGGGRVLASAPTEAKLDNLARQLAARAPPAAAPVVRIGRPVVTSPPLVAQSLDVQVGKSVVLVRREASKRRRELRGALLAAEAAVDAAGAAAARAGLRQVKKVTMRAVRAAAASCLAAARVVLCTAAGADSPSLRVLAPFDLVALDDAGATLEAASWTPVLEGKRAVLAGERGQLAATLASAEAASGVLGVSLLDRVCRAVPTAVTTLVTAREPEPSPEPSAPAPAVPPKTLRLFRPDAGEATVERSAGTPPPGSGHGSNSSSSSSSRRRIREGPVRGERPARRLSLASRVALLRRAGGKPGAPVLSPVAVAPGGGARAARPKGRAGAECPRVGSAASAEPEGAEAEAEPEAEAGRPRRGDPTAGLSEEQIEELLADREDALWGADGVQVGSREILSTEEERMLGYLALPAQKFERIQKQLAKDLGREPQANEVAEAAGLTPLAYYRQLHVAKAARRKLVRRNVRLVYHYAKRYHYQETLPMEDLCQEGLCGLRKAVERYDPTKNVGLAYFASTRIRIYMARANTKAGHMWHIPEHVAKRFYQIQKKRTELRKQLGRAPTDAELCAELNLKRGQFDDAVRSFRTPHSLHALHPVLGADNIHLLPDAGGHDEGSHRPPPSMSRELFAGVLDPVEAQIVEKRFGLDGGPSLSFEDIGHAMQVPRRTVSRRFLPALAKLKESGRLEGLIDWYKESSAAPDYG